VKRNEARTVSAKNVTIPPPKKKWSYEYLRGRYDELLRLYKQLLQDYEELAKKVRMRNT